MAYASNGRKPMERASKIAHATIVNDPDVAGFLARCSIPGPPTPHDLSAHLYPVEDVPTGHVAAVVAVDGGFTETYVREEFPSASVTFFTFGPLLFKLADLRSLDQRRFLAPEDLATLKHLQRFTLTLPTRGVRLDGETSLAGSIRRTIYEFFCRCPGAPEQPLIHSLAWLLFRRWRPTPDPSRVETLEHCPNAGCSATGLGFTFGAPYASVCPVCHGPVYLTDVFRLHELVDEELGAGGIATYTMTLLEHMVLIHVIRTVWNLKAGLLREILFLKDGPLAFFGVTAPLHTPMRELVAFLLTSGPSGAAAQPHLYLAGLEKSGAFVDHAAAVERLIPANTLMIPDNDYIRRYIVPGGPGSVIFGSNTYSGTKVFFKSGSGEMYVATLATPSAMANPTPSDIPNLHTILRLLADLRCSMYDNALVPIALANRLVSLSDFPSQRILAHFAGGVVS